MRSKPNSIVLARRERLSQPVNGVAKRVVLEDDVVRGKIEAVHADPLRNAHMDVAERLAERFRMR